MYLDFLSVGSSSKDWASLLIQLKSFSFSLNFVERKVFDRDLNQDFDSLELELDVDRCFLCLDTLDTFDDAKIDNWIYTKSIKKVKIFIDNDNWFKK